MKQIPTVIYEDEQLLIVSKPAGWLSIPDRQQSSDPQLMQRWLEQAYGRVWTVHRLDRETSGIMCWARNEQAHRALSQQFEQRKVAKYYQALVMGDVATPEGSIEMALAPHPTKPGVIVVSNKGKAALTTYRVVQRFERYTWLELQLHTGRTHQIRVHCQAIGHPLVADAVYSGQDTFHLSEVKGKKFRLGKDAVERPLLTRTALHASRLSLSHPVSGESMSWEAPLPKDLRATLVQLEKWLT